MPNNTQRVSIQQEKSLVDAEKLPLGQRLRRLGFRTIVDLGKELNCGKLSSDLNESRIDREKSKLYEKYGKEIEIDVRRYDAVFNIEAHKRNVVNKHITNMSFLSILLVSFSTFLDSGFSSLFNEREGGELCEVDIARVYCRPKISLFENYIHDDIPISVYGKVDQAKKEGLKDFYVAYPVIEEVKQVDPIVFAKLGDEMIFIAQWD